MLVAMPTFVVSEDVKPGVRYEGMDAASAVRSLLAKDALAVHVGAERLVSCTTQHAFAKAAHDAFYDHHPLVIRPDDVWFCIAQGFAHHVRENAEALRERFVRHPGKERLVVSRPDFSMDGDNPWPEAFEAFAGLIGDHVGPIRDLVAARFTTTTSVEAAAYDVCLMDTFQGYFEYEFRIGCGIPSITLLGTRADWESMIPRVRHLSEYGLAWWTGALVPILEQLARTADGDVDRAFWRSFFRYESGSGSAELTGWIVALFPYITDWRTKELERSPYVANWGERFRVSEARTGWLRMGEEQGPTIGMLPEGLVGAPVRLVDLATGEASDVRFVAGMFGVAQAEDTGALSSTFGWAVVRESTGHEQRAHPRSCARGRRAPK
jgi:hypothetical protein